jgi:hypothetical protein
MGSFASLRAPRRRGAADGAGAPRRQLWRRPAGGLRPPGRDAVGAAPWEPGAALRVSEPGDGAERAADRAVRALTSGPEGAAGPRCACGGTCARCRAAAARQELRRSALGPGGAGEGGRVAPPIAQAVVGSPGEPLDARTRAFMEPRFGHDFGRVRVHADARAGEAARAVDAHAYTVGEHIAFAPGRYAPETPAGRSLLAHELAHVVQQAEGGAPALQRLACNFYVYDSTEDTALGTAWEAAATGLALKAWGGYAIASGRSIETMLERVMAEYEDEDCDCTEEIQFLSHGSSGNAMYISGSGDEITATDFNIPELARFGDGPTWNDVFQNTPFAQAYRAWYDRLSRRQQLLVQLRRTICDGDGEVYYRSCEAFRGREGQEFARASADFWRTTVVGHTKVIGLTQPGRKSLDPGEAPYWSEHEGSTEFKKPKKKAGTKPKED